MSSKATAVLKRIKFFQELEDGVQHKLPSIVSMQHQRADTVIFQQDDPPGNCYVLLNGQVGVYSTRDEDAEWRDNDEDVPPGKMQERRNSIVDHVKAVRESLLKAEPATADSESPGRPREPLEAGGDRSSTDEHVSEPKVERASFLARRGSRDSRGSNSDLKICQTTEGFSVYRSVADLGRQVAILRGGTIFGELALINEQPRGASIRCLTDCDMLVITRNDFNRVLKEEMMRAGDEKLNFLAQHVPGMRDLEVPRFVQGKLGPHPAYFMRRAHYHRGHHFLTQGAVAQDAIYVVFKGCLEIQHRDDSLQPCNRGGTQRRRYLRAKGGYTPAAVMAAGAASKNEKQEDQSGTRTLGKLIAGSLFGSLPMQAPEPYTVVVSSVSCEVFQAVGPDVPKLPRRLLENVREYIANSTAWRLRTYVNHKSHLEMPKAPMRSESPPVSGARTSLEAKYYSLIHAT